MGIDDRIAATIESAREAARRMQCSNQQKQIVLALHNYHDAYDTFPAQGANLENGFKFENYAGMNVIVSVFPFMEQQARYEQIREKARKNAEVLDNVTLI